MRRAIVAVAVGLALAVTVPSAFAAHRPLPKLATGAAFGAEPTYALRPHTIWFTGDGTGILGRLLKGTPAVGKQPGFLHWKTWTDHGAYGVGTEWYKSGGGVGRFQRTPVTITLSDPRDGHFVKMTLHDFMGADTRCNPPGITFWTIPSGPPGNTSCRGARP
jgi:hypothetical protein